MIALYLLAGVLSAPADSVTPQPEPTIYGSGPFTYPDYLRKKYQNDEEEPEKPALEVVRIGPASAPIITGIVQPRQAARKPNTDLLDGFIRQQNDLNRAAKRRLRAQLMADDDWLMSF